MPGKWLTLAFVLAVTTTLTNAALFIAQFSTPASARVSGANSSKLLEDEDFVDGLAKLVRRPFVVTAPSARETASTAEGKSATAFHREVREDVIAVPHRRCGPGRKSRLHDLCVKSSGVVA
jgi:hypothetical protein